MNANTHQRRLDRLTAEPDSSAAPALLLLACVLVSALLGFAAGWLNPSAGPQVAEPEAQITVPAA